MVEPSANEEFYENMTDRRFWAFPIHKPQLFADSPTMLALGTCLYTFGARRSKAALLALAGCIASPGARRLVTAPIAGFEPDCGWQRWHHIRDRVNVAGELHRSSWIFYTSQWRKCRTSALAVSLRRRAQAFVTVEPPGHESFLPVGGTNSFRVPVVLDSFQEDGWLARRIEVLPSWHRTPSWDPGRIRAVARDVAEFLDGQLPGPPHLPPHWQPMHGDFVPWNLREDRHGQLWLIDWEDATWGPPLADLVRYACASYSLSAVPAELPVEQLHLLLGNNDEGIAEAARFWLDHRNLQTPRGRPERKGPAAVDRVRVLRETTLLEALAQGR